MINSLLCYVGVLYIFRCEIDLNDHISREKH